MLGMTGRGKRSDAHMFLLSVGKSEDETGNPK